MNADQVRAYVNAKWPEAMQSPVAQLFAGVAAHDEADRAIDFAGLQASATTAQAKQMRADALRHAIGCIHSCEDAGIAYDGETLSHNIESNFPELEIHECDAIAAQAMEYAS